MSKSEETTLRRHVRITGADGEATRLLRDLSDPFIAHWRVQCIDAAGNRELSEPAHLTISGMRHGHFQIGELRGQIDYRYTLHCGKPAIEFSWLGAPGSRARCGRGWAVICGTEVLRGRMFVHDGGELGFICRKGS